LRFAQLLMPGSHLYKNASSYVSLSSRLRAVTLPARRTGEDPARLTKKLYSQEIQEQTMRKFATVVLPLILAAGVSGAMFTATLV
jgi:hypothetical protein